MTMLRRVTIAAACAVGFSSTIFADEASWQALIDTGNRLMDENRYAGAAEAFRSAAAQAQASADGVRTGISLDHLGLAYDGLGRDLEAETSYRQAIAALEASGREGYPFLTRTWTDLGDLYLKLRRYDRAHNLAERALAALTRQPSEDIRGSAHVLTLLATIDSRQHKTNDAEARYRQAMPMLDRAGRSQSQEWIIATNNLGILLHGTGRLEEGGRYLREALSRSETMLGKGVDRLLQGQLLANVANLDFTLRRFEEAGRNLGRAVEIFESELGPTHPTTGDILMQYSALCRATKRKAEAKEYERRAKKCLTATGNAVLANTIDAIELRTRQR
jgi:tetratricopeptide (TPR) repeat protein